jgi:ribosomal protein S18 acetylase RimI-like enzyme
VRHPKIILHIIKGWGYAVQGGNLEREGDALFLGIKREYMRHGLAPELIRYSFAFMGSIGVETTTFMIEKRNRAMHWMISQMKGLQVIREFEAFGRKMILYRVPIAPNLTGTKLPLGEPYTPAHNYLTKEIGTQIGSSNLI